MSAALAARPGGIGSLGELLVEFVCTERDTGNSRSAPYIGPFASGAPGIFIDQAARVGARTIFSGAVGDDAFGRLVRERLDRAGVSDLLIRTVPDAPTGSAFVAYNSDGSREFVFNIAKSAAADFPVGAPAVDTLHGFGLAAFHISGSTLGNPSMASAALEICRALHGKGVAISFDPNIRKELLGDASYLDTVRSLLAISTYFLPSVEDADVLFPGEDFATFAPRLHEAGARYVVLKRGELGCIGAESGAGPISFDAHKTEVVDPTGAGDCFCATLVALIVSGKPFDTALRYANAAGALAVGKIGPMEGNSTIAEIDAFLASQP